MRWAALALLAGCATGGSRALGGPPGEGYDAALAHWTASAEVFSKADLVDRTAGVWATFQSPEFREARVRRWAEIAGLAPPEVDAKLTEERAEANAELDFWVGFVTEPSHANDLDTVHSIWHVSLVTSDGTVVQPFGIRAFDPPNLDQRALYPYLRDDWVGYWIRFPAAAPDGRPLLHEGVGRITLHFGSALGQMDLDYALPRSQATSLHERDPSLRSG